MSANLKFAVWFVAANQTYHTPVGGDREGAVGLVRVDEVTEVDLFVFNPVEVLTT